MQYVRYNLFYYDSAYLLFINIFSDLIWIMVILFMINPSIDSLLKNLNLFNKVLL